MSPDIPERSASMAWQVVDGEMVLLDIEGRELLGLNEVGARVWDLADGTRTIAEIASVVEREFEVGPEEAAADVERFVAELASRGALTLRRG